MARKNAMQPTEDQECFPARSNSLKITRIPKKVSPLTNNQQKFFNIYDQQAYFMALLGSAGTGKSYIALYKSLEEVLDRKGFFKKVVIVRSAVQSRDIGFTPGDVDEKLRMYEMPYMQVCADLFGRADAYQRLKEQKIIEFVSTSFLRGTSFSDCVIIMDEAQNASFQELNTIITRVGYQSKIIFCGDLRQNDLVKNRSDVSGMKKFIDIAKTMDNFSLIEFTTDDIVRSSLVKDWIVACEQHDDQT